MKLLRVLVMGLVVVLVSLGASAQEGAGELVPDLVDMAGHVDAFGAGVAVPIAAVVGLFFAFLIIRKALKWSGKAA